MRKNIIIALAVILILGGVIYIFIDKDKNPSIVNNEVENDVNEQGMDTEEFQPTIAVGERLPDFTLRNLDGEETSLKDYEGKIVLVNFWATWCVFCDEEMPDLQRLSEENDDLVVLGVNVEEEESVVQKYIDEGGYDFEILLDEKGKVAQEYLVSGLPASYFTNEEGIFLGRVPGMLTYEQMNEIIEDIRLNK